MSDGLCFLANVLQVFIVSAAQKRQYCSNCAKLLGHGAAICLPSVKWLRCTALAGDIVLWKLFRQTFYCHPEYGGGESWQSQHCTRDGNTLHILCDDNIMTIGHQAPVSGGWPQHRGRNDRNVTLGPSPGPAQGMITIHCLRYSVTRYMLQCSPLPRSPHPMYTTPHITLALTMTVTLNMVTWLHLTCVMCGVTVCPHRQQVNTLYTPSPSAQTAARHRYVWGHCPESLDKCLD